MDSPEKFDANYPELCPLWLDPTVSDVEAHSAVEIATEPVADAQPPEVHTEA
jgi:hypothetical protein